MKKFDQNFLLPFGRLLYRHRFLVYSFLLVILVFLITRLPFFLYDPLVDFDADTLHYYTLVDQMSKGIWPAFIIRTPGYPLFLKAVFTFFNTSMAVVVIQNLLTLLTALFFVFAVYKIVTEKQKYLALLAAAGISVFISSNLHLSADTRLLTESLYVNAILLFFAILLLALYGDKHRYWLLVSVSAAAVILIRPAGMFLIPVILFVMVFLFFNTKRRVFLLSLFIPVFVILLGASAYNYFTIGDFAISNFMEHALASYTSTFYEKNDSFGPTVNEGIEKCQKNILPLHKEIVFHSKNVYKVNEMMELYYNRNRVLLFGFFRSREQEGQYSLYMKWKPTLKKIGTYAMKKHPGIYLKYIYSNLAVYFFRLMDDPDFLPELRKRYAKANDYGSMYRNMLFNDGRVRLVGNGLRIYYKEEYVKSLEPGFLNFFLKEYLQPGAAEFPHPSALVNPAVTPGPSPVKIKSRAFFLQKLHRWYSKVHGFLFRNNIWVFIFFFVFIFSGVRLIQSRFHSKAALFMLVLTGSTIIHALGVCMSTFPITRYSYTMEFTYYLSFFLFPLLLDRER